MKNLMKHLQEKYHYAVVVFKELVKTDFQLRYQGSFLGMVWSVLKPLMLFGVMYVIFVRFLKFTDGTPTFAISLLCGTCLWSFFTESTTMGLSSIVNRGDLLRKVHFPNYIVVAATNTGALISLGLGLIVVILFGAFSGAHFTWRVLLVPFSIIQLYCLALGVSLVLATLYVYFRDIAQIWEVLLQALFYSIPIIYPLSMVARSYPIVAKLMMLNPIAQPIMDIRHNLLSPEYVPTVWTNTADLGGAIDTPDVPAEWQWLNSPCLNILPYLFTVLVLWLGIHLFRKYSQKFAEVL
ncbi:glycosyl transferase family 9 [Bifidobacterium sp. DSM 109957]|uniref:Transport permease protein n=2 Tax=Bifidobacterium oedipodis TaxID=2675322 RepID=A0A7Y0HTY8_9BIFI|nr:glycosyl transferase family 9 [Bifidobacterium sp. DSM 109957]